MSEKTFNESVSSLISGLDNFISSKSVVGEPVLINDTTIIPLMDVSLGVGAGAYGSEKAGTGGAMGAKLTPSAVLVIQDGKTKMISIKNQDPVAKIIDLIPQVLDRFTESKVKTDKETDNKINEILDDPGETETESEYFA